MEKITITAVSCETINFPLSSGGQLRTYHLYKNLPSNFKTLLINFDTGGSEKKFAENFRQYTIAKTGLSLMAEKWLNFFCKNSVSPIVISQFSKINASYLRMLDKCAKKSSVLVTDHPYNFISIKRYRRKLLVYNAHNVEYNMQSSIFFDNFIGRMVKVYVKWVERCACKSSHIILACSEDDKRELCLSYAVKDNKVMIIPNGVDADDIKPCSPEEKEDVRKKFGFDDKKIILFMASIHPPNLESVHYIVNRLAPLLGKCRIIIAGKIAKKFIEDMPVNAHCELFSKRKGAGNGKKTSGYGWYSLECWPKGITVRWTKKRFGLSAKRAITGFYFKACHPGEASGQVFVGGSKIGVFKARKKWETHEFRFNNTAQPVVEVELEKSIRPFGDDRFLGVAIAEIGYIYDNEKHEIDLKGIDNSVFDYNGNITFIGDLDEEDKKEVLKMSDIAINPTFRGSGTNLKMFEYMAAGLPVVTTHMGARGIELVNNEHCIMCSDKEFTRNIASLLKNDSLCEDISKNARRLIEEKYDWKILSTKLARKLEDDMKNIEKGAS